MQFGREWEDLVSLAKDLRAHVLTSEPVSMSDSMWEKCQTQFMQKMKRHSKKYTNPEIFKWRDWISFCGFDSLLSFFTIIILFFLSQIFQYLPWLHIQLWCYFPALDWILPTVILGHSLLRNWGEEKWCCKIFGSYNSLNLAFLTWSFGFSRPFT